MRRVSEGQLHLGGVSLRHFLSEKKVAPRKGSKPKEKKSPRELRLPRRFAPHNDGRGEKTQMLRRLSMTKRGVDCHITSLRSRMTQGGATPLNDNGGYARAMTRKGGIGKKCEKLVQKLRYFYFLSIMSFVIFKSA
jgi:hypothetical protein